MLDCGWKALGKPLALNRQYKSTVPLLVEIPNLVPCTVITMSANHNLPPYDMHQRHAVVHPPYYQGYDPVPMYHYSNGWNAVGKLVLLIRYPPLSDVWFLAILQKGIMQVILNGGTEPAILARDAL